MATVVLVVEDHVDVAQLLRVILEQEGFAVACAGNGHEALELLANVQPAIIISDVAMPRMSGSEFCSAIREHPLYTHIPIIVTSAMDEESARAEFDCYDAFVPKPYSVDVLIELVNKLLADEAEPGSRPRSSKQYEFGKVALAFLDAKGR